MVQASLFSQGNASEICIISDFGQKMQNYAVCGLEWLQKFSKPNSIVYCTHSAQIYRRSNFACPNRNCNFMKQPFARTYSNAFICKALCTVEQNSALHFILRNI